MRLRNMAAAAALLVVGAAHAAIQSFDGVTTAGNGSLVLVKLDSTGVNSGGLTVDLGYNYLDFANDGVLSAADTTVVWDFAANTITKNGALVTGVTNDWASQIALFTGEVAETKWAILSGSQRGNTPYGFLATGTPTPTQLIQQTAAPTAGFVQINSPLIVVAAAKGTLGSADNGAYAMGPTDAGYVGTAYSLNTINGWKNNIKWNTWSVDGASTNLIQLNANGSESFVGDASGNRGSFTLSGNTLTWTTAVPEPESYALAVISLAVIGCVARRRG